MGTKERMERAKTEVHNQILAAAMDIVKNEGCQSLSIRKIADRLEYTPPIIYSYFLNKEAVLIELCNKGYISLVRYIQQQLEYVTGTEERMEAVLMAYLHFAETEIELYQLMYTVGTSLDNVETAFPGIKTLANLFREEMQNLVKEKILTDQIFRRNFLICISFAHGFIALSRYYKDIDPQMNELVSKKAVAGIIRSIQF